MIAPDDNGYDAARTTFKGLLDRRPEVVVRPLDIDDVVAAVSFAGEAELPISVRGGGHSVAGHGIGDGSLVVDLRLMRAVVVDAGSRTAVCGGGSLWQDLVPRACDTASRHRAEPSATRASAGSHSAVESGT